MFQAGGSLWGVKEGASQSFLLMHDDMMASLFSFIILRFTFLVAHIVVDIKKAKSMCENKESKKDIPSATYFLSRSMPAVLSPCPRICRL